MHILQVPRPSICYAIRSRMHGMVTFERLEGSHLLRLLVWRFRNSRRAKRTAVTATWSNVQQADCRKNLPAASPKVRVDRRSVSWAAGSWSQLTVGVPAVKS